MLTIEDAIKDLIEAITAEMGNAIRAAISDPAMRAALVDAAIAEMKAQNDKHMATRQTLAQVVAPLPSTAEKPGQSGAPRAAPPPPASLPLAPPTDADGTLGSALRHAMAGKPAAPSPKPAAVTPAERLEDQWSKERDDLLRKLYCDDGLDPPGIVGPLNQINGPKVNAGVVTRRILFLQLRRATHAAGPSLPTPADMHQIRHWAAQRGMQVEDAADVADVNKERRKHNLPPFALKLPGWLNASS